MISFGSLWQLLTLSSTCFVGVVGIDVGVTDLSDPNLAFAANHLNWFSVDEGIVILRCVAAGWRCGIGSTSLFASEFNVGGVYSSLPTTTLWSPQTGLDNMVKLGSCKKPPCYIWCFQNCTCEVDRDNNLTTANEACPKVDPPPTPAPSPAPQGWTECPEIVNTEYCHALLTNGTVPFGTVCEPCHNFCGGKFQSCCNFATKSCGATACTDGISVLGCTEDQHGKEAAEARNNGNPSSATVAVAADSLFVAFCLVVLIFMAGGEVVVLV